MTVDYEVMKLSKLVEESLGDDPESHDNALLPLPKIKTQVLKKVIEYCTHYKHVEAMKEISTPLPGDVMEEIVQDWYCAFSDVDNVLKYEILSAANFLNIQPLLDLMCLRISVMIKGKTAEEIRRIFNIPEELTPEEEREILEENAWAMQAATTNDSSTEQETGHQKK